MRKQTCLYAKRYEKCRTGVRVFYGAFTNETNNQVFRIGLSLSIMFMTKRCHTVPVFFWALYIIICDPRYGTQNLQSNIHRGNVQRVLTDFKVVDPNELTLLGSPLLEGGFESGIETAKNNIERLCQRIYISVLLRLCFS